MTKAKRSTIEVKGAAVAVLSQNQQDFICITDIARYKDVERTDYLLILSTKRSMPTIRLFNLIGRFGITAEIEKEYFQCSANNSACLS